MRKLLVVILTLIPTTSFGGEVTYTQWHPVYSRLDITYFDTAGRKAICTVFYNDKPVGANSAYLSNGIANVEVWIPSGVKGEKNVTYACRTE